MRKLVVEKKKKIWDRKFEVTEMQNRGRKCTDFWIFIKSVKAGQQRHSIGIT